jgi:hypothetical protein
VRFRPNRASRWASPNHVTPHKFSLGLFAQFTPPEQDVEFWRGAYCGRLERLILGGDVAGKCDAGSPGSGGASPYLRRGS